MKITEIEAIALRLPYEERIRRQYYHFAMREEHTVYKFHTDTGLVGLGENPGAPFGQEMLDPYLGTDPFDHVMSTGLFNLDMACYDLMGKHLGVPAWKVMGQQRRQWVNMGWWMPCMSPEDSAAEVEIAAARGYRGLKCKARAFYDVVAQAQAMHEVAPRDFRVEFDFNGSLINVEKALPVLRELEKISVVKGLEEPIFAYDVEGWRRLHRKIRIPFYLHGVSTIFDGASRQPSGPWLGLRAGDFDGAPVQPRKHPQRPGSFVGFCRGQHTDTAAVCRNRHHRRLRMSIGCRHAHRHAAGSNGEPQLRRRPHPRAAHRAAGSHEGARWAGTWRGVG